MQGTLVGSNEAGAMDGSEDVRDLEGASVAAL
jgi:hypothetical protein